MEFLIKVSWNLSVLFAVISGISGVWKLCRILAWGEIYPKTRVYSVKDDVETCIFLLITSLVLMTGLIGMRYFLWKS